MTLRITVASAALLGTSIALGHHSDVGLDMDGVTLIEGTVTQFNWRNPHVYLLVEAPDANGELVEWSVQMGSTIVVTRMGWNQDSIVPGDHVIVGLHAARNGRPYGLIDSIVKEGVALPTSMGARTSEPLIAVSGTPTEADSVAGLWIADVSKLVSYPGGLDGFFMAQLQLTAAGQAAAAAYDEISELNPGASCIGLPTPAIHVMTNLYPLQIEIDETAQRAYIRSEYFDEERIVYLDGRGHPENGERTLSGHSIGRFEGDTFVVDTALFADHRSPYQTGVPSGAQKHVVERFRLLPDRTRMIAEFVLEDPEYLAEPLSHSRELIYSPQMGFSEFNCDVEATRRFLPSGN
jgi:hypothetical protein